MSPHVCFAARVRRGTVAVTVAWFTTISTPTTFVGASWAARWGCSSSDRRWLWRRAYDNSNETQLILDPAGSRKMLDCLHKGMR